MPDSKILSVVIAAYNCSDTLSRIFDHLNKCKNLEQLEAIIVNDGSKDNTSEIAHQIAAKYPTWVQVIDKANGGHGSALTAGFQQAHGKYCRPLDGDDWLDEKGLDALLGHLASCDADMVVSDLEVLNLDTGQSKIITSSLKPSAAQTVADIIPIEPMPGYHATTFSTAILRSIPPLDSHCFYVDNEYNTYPLFEVKKLYYYPDVVYVHTVGNDEQSTSLHSLVKNINNLRTVFFSLMRYAAQHQDHHAATVVTHRFAGSVLGTFTNVTFVEDPSKGRRDLQDMYLEVRSMYPDFYKGRYLKPLGKLCRALHLHGYSTIRLLVHLKNRGNARIVW